MFLRIYTPWFGFLFLSCPFPFPAFSVFSFIPCFYLPPSLYFLLMHLSSPVPFSLASNLSPSHLTRPCISSSLPDPFIHLRRILSRSIFPSLRFWSLTDSQTHFLALEGEADEASGQLPDFFAKISEENGRGGVEGGGWFAENDEFASFGGWIKAPPHFKYTEGRRDGGCSGWIDRTNL